MVRFKGKFANKNTFNRLYNLSIISGSSKCPTTTAHTGYMHHSTAEADQNDHSSDSFVIEGRRVIDVAFLAHQMICQACGQEFHL